MVLRGIISKKIPVIKELGVFYQSWYCKDHGNQGSDNQGPAVHYKLYKHAWKNVGFCSWHFMAAMGDFGS